MLTRFRFGGAFGEGSDHVCPRMSTAVYGTTNQLYRLSVFIDLEYLGLGASWRGFLQRHIVGLQAFLC